MTMTAQDKIDRMNAIRNADPNFVPGSGLPAAAPDDGGEGDGGMDFPNSLELSFDENGNEIRSTPAPEPTGDAEVSSDPASASLPAPDSSDFADSPDVAGNDDSVETAKVPIYRGPNKDYFSQEELISDFKQLQQAAIEKEVKGIESVGEPVDPGQVSDDLLAQLGFTQDDMFARPGEVLAAVAQHTKTVTQKEAQEKSRKEQEIKQYWESFYGDFADLKGQDRAVQFVYLENQGEIEKLQGSGQLDGARNLLAKKTREWLNQIRTHGQTQELNRAPIQPLGASGADIAPPRVPKEPEPQKMADQLKTMRAKAMRVR
jgi:hypothetical protein